ncbi:membrane protein DedA with SNARE-associated domain [Kribbella voronezhensis]|uniref:Membrane protein DedA with SNARE-associated domain n=1 Tax=Kribbella voronezhensis TaxID=2512212 RepID=A0A4R7TEH1_9ACTN|nr:DedA family protein [Kribbella voronezhensis]TDU90560.1 membrane protein DedA with SNARE-associated domain [Kribbella voronezhensis]
MGATMHALAIAIPTGGIAIVAYLVVGLVIGVESMGVPLPGETTLVAAALLASQGNLNIYFVIGAAATGAIIGDSIGYFIGRKAGRSLFERLGRRFHHFSEDRIAKAEKYFHRYGVWTVFFGRFVALLRIFAGPMAGMLRMSYPRFLAANAAGGIAWSTTIGVVAYKVGDNADKIFGQVSVWALVAIGVVAVAAYVVLKLRRRRVEAPSGPMLVDAVPVPAQVQPGEAETSADA